MSTPVSTPERATERPSGLRSVPPVPTGEPGDPGLFGPDSVSWQVHSDPSMAFGGLRALMLQTLHPMAMHGVAQHSDFKGDPWGRLFRTADFVGALTYASTRDAERAAARVRGVHRKLPLVTDPLTGETRRVDDPELLLWVHCSEVESFLSTAVRSGARISPTDQDRYYAEQVTAAVMVGVDRADVPASVEQMAGYFATVRPRLRVTTEAREAIRFITVPPMPRWVGLATPAKPAWVGLAAVAFAMLPRWARRMFALPGLPTTDLSASVAGLALRTALSALPERLSNGPQLTAAKKRLELTS